jgi:hypothetical protein
METQSVQADGSGRYTAMLGATRNDGIPADVLASEQGRWLGVQPQGEAEQPRVLLVSVPYALKASDADTLGGKPASAYLLAGSSTGAQPEGPSSAAQPAQPEAAVSVKTAAGVKPAFTSAGTTNYLSKFTDTSGDVANSVMYQNGSNVGVGTTAGAISMDVRPTATSPYAQLGVAQTVDYMTLFASDTYGPAFYWDPTKALRFGKGGTALYNANGFVEYMRIQPNGYVGIGTQTPAATLEVNGNAQVDGNLTLSNGGILVSQLSGGFLTVLQAPLTGSANFGVGLNAMVAASAATAGSYNTAVGDYAIGFLPTFGYCCSNSGSSNTAVGFSALIGNGTGSNNTANGAQAMFSNTTGGANTAAGLQSLYSNTTGGNNTASGFQALYSSTTGFANTATGASALSLNSGSNNTADGAFALQDAGGNFSWNTAVGAEALYDVAACCNTAVGYQALYNGGGPGSIAIGYQAGYLAGSGSIYIGNQGEGDDSTIRIGTLCPNSGGCQTAAYIAGIYGNATSLGNAVPVLIDSNGNLGTASSSRRYKKDIQDMAAASSGLMRLRPVTFRYNKPLSDGSQPIQYGLIAEEVAEVYPDLVARSADGQIETVKYQLLDPMLLNELQKQNATIASQKEQIGAQEQQIRSLEERMAKLESAREGAGGTGASH